jgi:hypothetical protein
VSLHHAVQSAGFDLFLQPDLVEAWVIQREAVTETNTGEVPVRKQDRHAPILITSGNKHVGIRDAVDVGDRGERIARPCPAADRLDGRLVKPRPPAPAENPAGFAVDALGEDSRVFRAWCPPTARRPASLPVMITSASVT